MGRRTDTYLDGANSTYLLGLAKQYATNPNSVPEEWCPFFENLSSGDFEFEQRPEWGENLLAADSYSQAPRAESSSQTTNLTRQEIIDSLRAVMLVRAYRVRGHMLANLDPLGLAEKQNHSELDPANYGFKPEDYNRVIFLDGVLGFETATLNEIITKLHKVYAGHIGAEFMHIQEPAQKSWIQERIENDPDKLTKDQKITLLKDLTRAEAFERSLHVKFPGAKRFGLDGGESVVCALESMLRHKARAGTEEVIFGMSHRGRLSVLANVMQKPLKLIFGQFDGFSIIPEDVQASGDVKYHLGYSKDRIINGKEVHLSLTPNPSHLEAVNPVVIGKVRARQDQKNDRARSRVLGVLLHGDAAFAGQGVVAETLAMTGLDGYETGGTIHVVVNNQIGFTTIPPLSRSCPYATDIGKFIQAPVFHVNGDDPEAVERVARIAAEYHTMFKHDVIIDIVCYRRYGHNEGDEPMFTQPLMYKKIKEHPTTRTIFEKRLKDSKVLSDQEAQTIIDDANYEIQSAIDAVQKVKSGAEKLTTKADWMEGRWSEVKEAPKHEDLLRPIQTGIDLSLLKKIGLKSTTVPADIAINSKIKRQLDAKNKIFEKGEGAIDWATAESLAFGSILLEGNPVRLAGQDCERGTFSQRHAVLVDQETERKYTPLNHLEPTQENFEIVNSLLSELAVLGFEYGYSFSSPRALVCWEAQFGDFTNGAQIIIDQYLSSAEAKWLRLSGLTLLLPHGFEGQGPEHSSARLERFLQNSADNNWYVANCTTPANYFHILRRQMRSPYRKPLVLMTPKSLLRHKRAISDLSHMGPNTHFKTVINDHYITPDAVKRVVLCSGKIYYELLEAREKNNVNDVALIRLEQYFPFPKNDFEKTLETYPNVPVVWCQEEPENMGAWNYLDRKLESVMTSVHKNLARPVYIGRPASASPATGLASRHVAEQNKIISDALMLEKRSEN